MQVKVQKSTSTTLPRKSAGDSGGELSHSPAPESGGISFFIGAEGGEPCITGNRTLAPVADCGSTSNSGEDTIRTPTAAMARSPTRIFFGLMRITRGSWLPRHLITGSHAALLDDGI